MEHLLNCQRKWWVFVKLCKNQLIFYHLLFGCFEFYYQAGTVRKVFAQFSMLTDNSFSIYFQFFVNIELSL